MIKKIVASFFIWFFVVQAFAVNPDDLLRPEEAFKPNITALSSDSVKATWDIADDYYMYRKRFKFESDTPALRWVKQSYLQERSKMILVLAKLKPIVNRSRLKFRLYEIHLLLGQ